MGWGGSAGRAMWGGARAPVVIALMHACWRHERSATPAGRGRHGEGLDYRYCSKERNGAIGADPWTMTWSAPAALGAVRHPIPVACEGDTLYKKIKAAWKLTGPCS